MKLDREHVVAVGIALLGFAVRLYRIDVPDRLIGDEVYYVPAARSILGQNEEGVPRDRLLGHPPLAKMIIAAGMLFFGDNPFGWRIMSVFAGTLVIPVFYLVARRLAEGRKELASAPLLAMFMVSFETLSFYFSRVARIDIFMILFFLAGVYFLLDRQPARRLLSAPFFAASFLCKEVAVLMILPLLGYIMVREVSKKDKGRIRKVFVLDFRNVGLLAAATAAATAVMWYLLEWVILTPSRPNIVDRVLTMFSRLAIENPAAVGRSEIWMWFFNQPVTRAAAVHPGVRVDFSTVVVGPLLNPDLRFAYIVQPSWTIVLPMIPVAVYYLFRSRADSVARFVAVSWFGIFAGWVFVNLVYRGLVYLFYVLTLIPPLILGISFILSAKLYEEKKTKSIKWFTITLLFLLLHTVNFLALYPVPLV
ncbi:MAG: glycosyltransferase family 39 protein [Candidatus Caldarchaeum sp.]